MCSTQSSTSGATSTPTTGPAMSAVSPTEPVAAPVAPVVAPPAPAPKPKRSVFGKVGHGVRVLLHDPNVRRGGKSLAAVLVVRGAVAFGASAATVAEIIRVLHAVGL